MKARIDLMHVTPGVIHAMLGLERQVQKAGLDTKRLDLVRMRASQINAWNRLNIAARTVPGDYVVGSLAKVHAARADRGCAAGRFTMEDAHVNGARNKQQGDV